MSSQKYRKKDTVLMAKFKAYMSRLSIILSTREFSSETLPNYRSARGNEDLHNARSAILDKLLLPLTEAKYFALHRVESLQRMD